MREVLEFHRERIASSDVLQRLDLVRHRYFVVSAHREENVDARENLTRLFEILDVLVKEFGHPVIFSAHPRTRKRIESSGMTLPPEVQLHKPFGFLDYVRLQMDATAVLSDSGTVTEESSILNFPAVNLREAHERPEGFEEAAVMFVGLNAERVLDALRVLDTQGRGHERTLRMVSDYEPDNVSDKVVRIILSYTDFVNRVVWKQYS